MEKRLLEACGQACLRERVKNSVDDDAGHVGHGWRGATRDRKVDERKYGVFEVIQQRPGIRTLSEDI
jgi:hypothetical protein